MYVCSRIRLNGPSGVATSTSSTSSEPVSRRSNNVNNIAAFSCYMFSFNAAPPCRSSSLFCFTFTPSSHWSVLSNAAFTFSQQEMLLSCKEMPDWPVWAWLESKYLCLLCNSCTFHFFPRQSSLRIDRLH